MFQAVSSLVSPRRLLTASLFAAAAFLPFTVQAQSKDGIVVATSILSQHNDPTAVVSTADYMVDDMLYDGLTNIVDVYIRHLRSKIDDRFPRKLIQTVRGIGYMIEAPEVAAGKPEERQGVS
jgi:hypothetical protein